MQCLSFHNTFSLTCISTIFKQRYYKSLTTQIYQTKTQYEYIGTTLEFKKEVHLLFFAIFIIKIVIDIM